MAPGESKSRDRKRHVTVTGRCRDTSMLGPIILNMTGDTRWFYDFINFDPKLLGHPGIFG